MAGRLLALLVLLAALALAAGDFSKKLDAYKNKWSLCARDLMAAPVKEEGKEYLVQPPSGKKQRNACTPAQCKPKKSLQSLFNKGDSVTPAEMMLERFWMEIQYTLNAAVEANKVEGAGGRYDTVVNGEYLFEGSDARKHLAGWGQEKFCQLDCDLASDCLEAEVAAKLVKSSDRADGFTKEQAKSGAASSAVAGVGSESVIPTGLITADGTRVALKSGDSAMSCEKAVKCTLHEASTGCETVDSIKNVERVQVVRTLVGQTLQFIELLGLKPNATLPAEDKEKASQPETIEAVDEKFVIHRVCAFLEADSADVAKSEKAGIVTKPEKSHKLEIKAMFDKKASCIRDGSKDFEVR